MHHTVKNLLDIENNIKTHLNKLNVNNNPKIVAVSKTFKIDKILPLIEHGHIDYGENKVQEAVEKWTEIKKKNSKVKLHMIGKLQTNKVKFAVQIFDYIHSVDNEKLAKKIADEQHKINRKIKIFLQVNIGDEYQKSGFMWADGADVSFPASPSAPVCAVGGRSGEPGTPVAILIIGLHPTFIYF